MDRKGQCLGTEPRELLFATWNRMILQSRSVSLLRFWTFEFQVHQLERYLIQDGSLGQFYTNCARPQPAGACFDQLEPNSVLHTFVGNRRHDEFSCPEEFRLSSDTHHPATRSLKTIRLRITSIEIWYSSSRQAVRCSRWMLTAGSRRSAAWWESAVPTLLRLALSTVHEHTGGRSMHVQAISKVKT